MNQEKTVSEAIQYRRSVRIYDAEKAIDKNIVKKCVNNLTEKIGGIIGLRNRVEKAYEALQDIVYI